MTRRLPVGAVVPVAILALALAAAGCSGSGSTPVPANPSPPGASEGGSVASETPVPSEGPASPGEDSTPGTEPTADPFLGAGQLLGCGDRGRDFPASALAGPGTAEDGSDAAAAILRSTVSTAPAETPFPGHGWHRVLDDQRGAWFVAAGDPRTPWWQVNVGVLGGVLQATEEGECHLSVAAPPDVTFGRWWLDPSTPAPSPDSREVSILVRETACASGHSPEGRVLPPTIVIRGDAVEVTIAIRHRPGGQDCPGNPSYPMQVRLPEALGTHHLFDASWYPPRLVTSQDPG